MLEPASVGVVVDHWIRHAVDTLFRQVVGRVISRRVDGIEWRVRANITFWKGCRGVSAFSGRGMRSRLCRSFARGFIGFRS
jgi:hypothetical protein